MIMYKHEDLDELNKKCYVVHFKNNVDIFSYFPNIKINCDIEEKEVIKDKLDNNINVSDFKLKNEEGFF